ncbi:DEAD-domain-containing protein [Violaceomyces palustris]|uniref:DEAD-domain-containing protein n=1 Tax=Violaceomyces palustris TaxID=1673888 RepID=A0ACD0NRD7_9BASI|nr:DEAD-domain-containing protein [Violaceomyces palustris]
MDQDDLLLNFAPSPSVNPRKRPIKPSSSSSNRDTHRNGAKKEQSKKRKLAPSSSHQQPRAKDHHPSKPSLTSTSSSSSSSSKPQQPFKPAHGIISNLFPSVYTRPASQPEPTSTPQTSSKPSNAPSESHDFASLGLSPLIVDHLENRMSIGSRPTSIQRVALPFLLERPDHHHHQAAAPDQRDVLIQAQTGSGKTLTFLLPILQSLLPLCEESFIDRSVGTLAIILTPTRELARQIYDVLTRLLSLSLTTKDELQQQQQDEQTSSTAVETDDTTTAQPVRRTRWMVPGLLTGGSTRNHEKQRLRKGCPILVSTPGRLLDHLQNTSSFDVGKCRWLVLDEADRLLELGFKDQLEGIVKALDGRRRLALGSAREAMLSLVEADGRGAKGKDDERLQGGIPEDQVTDSMGVKWWSKRRRSILCSATLDDQVKELAGNTLKDPLILRGGGDDDQAIISGSKLSTASSPTQGQDRPASSPPIATTNEAEKKFSVPAQLVQNYVVTPPKLRLVTLIALLRSYLSKSKEATTGGEEEEEEEDSRIIVFMSCTDSVDFHWKALGSVRMDQTDEDLQQRRQKATEKRLARVSKRCQILGDVAIQRLHGSMSQQERIDSLRAFSETKPSGGGGAVEEDEVRRGRKKASVLFCTSVASRGLDLPRVGCVIQLDSPTEGGIEEYLHRVGRTARVGKKGQSWLMLLPNEQGWIKNLESRMIIQTNTDTSSSSSSSSEQRVASIRPTSVETVLRVGFGTKNASEYQSRATQVQLCHERWVISSESRKLVASKAFLSHIRAYSTHPSSEKVWFNTRDLHLGHLAKSFALREAPKQLARSVSSKRNEKDTSRRNGNGTSKPTDPTLDDHDDDSKTKRKPDFAKGKLLSIASKVVSSSSPSVLDLKGNKGPMHGSTDKEKETEARMYAKVRALGKLSRKNGVLAAHGTDEFQIA